MKMPHLISGRSGGHARVRGPAARAESLTLYCAADEVWCQLMARGFEEETGITVDMSRKSSGEIYAQVKAEAENPKGDVWWAGTGDPHLQAAEEGLTEEYVSPMRDQLQPWAIKQAEASGNKTVGVYSGALGFGYNKDLLEKNGLPEPEMLGRPDQAGIQGPHPGRQPELVGHGLHDAGDDGAAVRRGQGLRVPEGPAQERQPVHQVGLRADQGGGPRRDHDRHRLHA